MKSNIDTLMGSRFGRLVVVGKVNEKRRWKAVCKCDCGNETTVNQRELNNGDTTSCGCFHREMVSRTRSAQLIGRVFDRLTVVERGSGIYEGRRKVFNNTWICNCSCGNTVEVSSNSLLKGNTTSCGCKAAEKGEQRLVAIAQAKSNTKTIVNQAKDKAIRRGHDWRLTDDQALAILTKPCAYCGDRPRKIHAPTGTRYGGIDRIDSNIGYEEGNVVPCCTSCNVAKNDKSVEDFEAHVKKMYKGIILRKKNKSV